MFTFKCDSDQKRFTMIQNSGDKQGLSFGLQSCRTDLITALTMIEDVIKNYTADSLKEDSTVMTDVQCIVEAGAGD